jgi:hypothetical protein
MWNMRRIAYLVLPALLACASSGTGTGASAPVGPAEGTYEYVANLPGLQVRGTMRVQGDTVLVDPVSDYCRPSIGAPDPMSIRYTCVGSGSYEQILLAIDRRHPAQMSKWTARYRVQRRREVCVQYAYRDGRQVCVQTTTETYETTESRSGTLLVQRKSPTA